MPRYNCSLTHSNEPPALDRKDALDVTLNNFDACNDDISQVERFRIDEFFCLKLKADPSKRTELLVCKSTFDILNSDEKISFSSGTVIERIKEYPI